MQGGRSPTYPRPVRIRRGLALASLVLIATMQPALAAPSQPPTPRTYTYPPPARTPTDHANSPDAPDPHPPAGGIGPTGQLVGGARLARRGLVLPKHAPKLPKNLTARAWVLVDLDSGNILGARDPHGRYQPASILKILTSATLIPRLPGDTEVKATKQAADTEGSHAGLVAKGHYTVDDLFRGLLLVSGNDTAVALAQAAGGVRKTVSLMNKEALALGGYDTYVETPSGLDGWKQLTSAYDMALFLRAALAQPRFAKYDRTIRAFLPKERIVGRVELDNQNAYFLQHVPGALVAKTGYTDAAQHTFAGAIERHGRRLGVIFLRAQRWPIDQWQQAVRLIDWGFRLPTGTAAVGRLETPAVDQPPPKLPTHTAQPTKAAAKQSGSHRSTWQIALAIGAGLVFAGCVVWVLRRRPARR